MAMKGEKGVSFRTTYLPGENVGRNTSFGIDPGMGVPVAAYGDGEAIDIDLKEAFQGRLMRNSDHLLWLASARAGTSCNWVSSLTWLCL